MKAVTNGILFIDGKWLSGYDLILGEGKIKDIVPAARTFDAPYIDAGNRRVVPGFIDIHIHGSSGWDTMDGTEEAIKEIAAFLAAHGTTSFLPTTMSCPLAEIRRSAENVYHCMQQDHSGAQVLGLHLEGPFLNACAKGAHPEEHILPPDLHGFQEMTGEAADVVRLVTMAPEAPGARELTSYLKGLGIAVSIGHTTADYDHIGRAVGWGMTHTCHFYNAMTPLKHRDPGVVGAILDNDTSTIELIADLIHVHPAALRLAARTKGRDRTVLITDAMAAAGLGDGVYELGGGRVYVKDGQARLQDGTLAGSTLTQDQALRNMVGIGIPLEDALIMLTATPAAVVGAGHRKGKIERGYDADLVILDEELTVQDVCLMGRQLG